MTYWVVQAIKKISKVHTQEGMFDGVSFTKRHKTVTANRVVTTITISENAIVSVISGSRSRSRGSILSCMDRRNGLGNVTVTKVDPLLGELPVQIDDNAVRITEMRSQPKSKTDGVRKGIRQTTRRFLPDF